jgi:hypothetical protein
MKEIVLVGLLSAAAATATAGQDALNAAKDLYASAAYEEALNTLSGLGDAPGGSAPAVARQVDEYRAFCLFALGRTAEAESVAEALIRREPLVQLEAADASPRLEAMFVSVRKRVLPSVIRDHYKTARGLVEKKQYAEAEPRLAEARRMLTEAERLGAWDPGLADLGILVDGFLSLSRANVTAAAAPAPVSTQAAAPSTTPPASTPVSAPPRTAAPAPTRSAANAPLVPPSRVGSAPARTAASDAPATASRVYTVEDENVTPPVALYQRAPSAPAELLTIVRALRRQMILNVTIDETGNVVKADVRVSINPSYDDLVVRAASNWKYRPAMKDGAPVSYEKTILIDIK